MEMIESIEFKNFKALRDTVLPLGPLTILIGPNGSGKSTVLQALAAFQHPNTLKFKNIVSFDAQSSPDATVQVQLRWHYGSTKGLRWKTNNSSERFAEGPQGVPPQELNYRSRIERSIGVFSFDAQKIAATVPVQKGIVELAGDGAGLASVLDGMRDDAPVQFNAIQNQLREWLPEYDCILFDRPSQGSKSIALRTKEGQHKVPASDLSQGTLISLALLTLAYHPTRPSLIALEEPDRGIHPYLLRNIKDVLIRLSYPESCGEKRDPVQVIATTHSPYFVDLFRETPECVVVANKVGLDVKFERLTDQPHFHDIVGQAALGDAWYSGVLGGVPSGS